LDQLCSELNIHSLPRLSRAVLVGTAFNPSKIDRKPDGSEVHTLWGELAWQLGGATAYGQIAESDRSQVPPGARALAALFEAHGPCLILLDEWVAYARNLVSPGKSLPAGSFDAQLSFAQQLTEAVKQVPNALLLISVPQSRHEIGGSDGETACDDLKNIVTRLAYQWQPASGTESFEIVRRRLFEPITTKEAVPTAMPWCGPSAINTPPTRPTSRRRCVRAATATCSPPLIRSTPSCSTASTRSGAPSIASSAPAACCACSPSRSKASGTATAKTC
jgi:hypothetical protein